MVVPFTVTLVCKSAKSLQSCLTLRNPTHSRPPGFPLHGILQVRILEWVAMPSSRGSFQSRDGTHIYCISCIVGGLFTTKLPGKPLVRNRVRNKVFGNIMYRYSSQICGYIRTFLLLISIFPLGFLKWDIF